MIQGSQGGWKMKRRMLMLLLPVNRFPDWKDKYCRGTWRIEYQVGEPIWSGNNMRTKARSHVANTKWKKELIAVKFLISSTSFSTKPCSLIYWRFCRPKAQSCTGALSTFWWTWYIRTECMARWMTIFRGVRLSEKLSYICVPSYSLILPWRQQLQAFSIRILQ